MPEITFTLNNEAVTVEIAPHEKLAYVLRDKLDLIGTKIGCGEAECGACTVIVDGEAVDSCIYPAAKVAGCRVETIEGLKHNRELHAIQQAFIEHAGSQCGYCTPGFIMSVKALLDKNPTPTRDEILEAISGNICRCTGYYQIVESIEAAVEHLTEEE